MQVRERLKDLTRPTGEEELMRVEYPRPRWAITPRQGIAVACAALILLGLWWIWPRGDEEDTAFLAPSGVAALPTLSPSTTTEEPQEIVVAVVGQVDRPGLVRLPPQARVSDALAQAGPRPEADTLPLNLARRVEDGEQIYVPAHGEGPGAVSEPLPSPGPAASAEPGKISLNKATVEELTTLNGVGEVTARAIVEYRDSHGGFSEVAQLQEVRGIGPAKYAALESQVVP
ncbi:ComEA family DNA-binding protein [Corynebacterium lowii]|uniref:ComE operon protein 1 n=1 Tax=Corynebacterium lowii TaxID=1544413 RepID=A0A0Q1AJC6_9CORY|nr:ComEA family DNA-binding protein [Corynebacterium lowii]KQB86923.1 ComE operon protein 1 [Corynebacterium lowii]MDP9851612.1 competence protein ComEA [Corynebacterium lowii]